MRVPEFKDPDVKKYAVELDRELQQMRKDFVSSITGNRALMLYSPDKSVWEVKVTDAGALTVTKVATV